MIRGRERNLMLTPKVIEQKRGSAHGGTVGGTAVGSAAAR
jgi:hypothetical protein